MTDGRVLAVRVLSTVGQIFDRDTVYLDTGSGVHLFCNKELLTTVRKAERPVRVAGIDAGTHAFTAKERGMFGGVEVLVSDRAIANILSQGQLVEHGHVIRYRSSEDVYRVYTRGGSSLSFQPKSGGRSWDSLCNVHEVGAAA